jgi:hypothetical protein
MGSRNPHCLLFLLEYLLGPSPKTSHTGLLTNAGSQIDFQKGRYHTPIIHNLHTFLNLLPPEKKSKYTFLCILCSLLDLTTNRILVPVSMWILRVLLVLLPPCHPTRKGPTDDFCHCHSIWPLTISRPSWIPLWLTFSIHQHTIAKVYIWCSSHQWLKAFNFFSSNPWGKVKKALTTLRMSPGLFPFPASDHFLPLSLEA